MKQLIWRIIFSSFVVFFIVATLIGQKLFTDRIQDNARKEALIFHNQIKNRIILFEQIINLPVAILDNKISNTLPEISTIILSQKLSPFDWSEEELTELAKKYELTSISIFDLNAIRVTSTNQRLNRTIAEEYPDDIGRIKNIYNQNFAVINKPKLNLMSGNMDIQGFYGPSDRPDILIESSINMKQFVSGNYSNELFDYLFFEFLSEIQPDQYTIGNFDLIFEHDGTRFSLIGDDDEIAPYLSLLKGSEPLINQDQDHLFAITQFPSSDDQLHYADRIIIRSAHKYEIDEKHKLKIWFISTGLLILLLVIIRILLDYYFSSAVSKHVKDLKVGINNIALGNYDQFPQSRGLLEFKEITESLNSARLNFSIREETLIKSQQDLEKIVEDRTDALRHEIDQRSRAEFKLKEMSLTDHLTQIGNRRQFDSFLNGQFALYKRKVVPFSINLLDVDYFKQTNDLHGHPAGDAVLIQLASLVKSLIREYDCFCRIGGEEFAILLPETDLEGARRFAERVIEKIRLSNFIIDAGVIKTTVSIGVAEISPRDIDGFAMLKRADHALYNAKRSGRDRLEMS